MPKMPTAVEAPAREQDEPSDSMLIAEAQRGRFRFPSYPGSRATWPANTAGLDEFCAPDSTSKLPEQGKDRSFSKRDLDPKY